ncbi:hypothetical protein CCACVL1_15626 [Corchorus capsularis]|uniref:Uncharacterized protein n=1 Tax=Corchorus capsularis TaxID=210143 RepID=A0A1R3I1P9_COCAP|nr:hypothetical protein CCACVL1_15626 [Corchorus capsularis]
MTFTNIQLKQPYSRQLYFLVEGKEGIEEFYPKM